MNKHDTAQAMVGSTPLPPFHACDENTRCCVLAQMWDRDILKWNDCIAEATLDLDKPFRKAFKHNTQVLKLFESSITEEGNKKLVSSMIKRQEALAAEQVTAAVAAARV